MTNDFPGALPTTSRPRGTWVPFYYGWVIVVLASIAMTATLPGRSHGLSLVTEPLIADLGMNRPFFARINLVTSLLGAVFCLPVGWLLDRMGSRWIFLFVVTVLGLSVLGMARVTESVGLFFALLFVRGFGQSALSVVSMASVGKWFRRRLGMAMGVYTVLLTMGFIGTILWTGAAVKADGWRTTWSTIGWTLLAVAPVGWLLQRNSPEECGQQLDAEPVLDPVHKEHEFSLTLREALRTPAFWVFALGTSTFNLVWSGVTLFNESVLNERGFDSDAAMQVMAVLTATGLVSNLIAGALVRRERLGMLLGLGMAILTVSLALLPSITTRTHLWLYASAMGVTGGLVMVVFFSAWGQVFGRKDLGKIQGAAQLISVLASAVGPELLAECQALLGAYTPVFYGLAGITSVLAVLGFWVPLPALSDSIVSEAELPGIAPAFVHQES